MNNYVYMVILINVDRNQIYTYANKDKYLFMREIKDQILLNHEYDCKFIYVKYINQAFYNYIHNIYNNDDDVQNISSHDICQLRDLFKRNCKHSIYLRTDENISVDDIINDIAININDLNY